MSDAQIMSGAGSSGAAVNELFVSLDNTALAEIVVGLSSDNPAILSVPSQVTLLGTWTTGVNLSAAAITGPLRTVGVHSSYAGKSVSSTVQILPRPSVLQGQVTDSSLKPVADASVLLSASGPITPTGGNTLQLSTDANGSYQTPDISPQFYQVSAVQSGYWPSQATVTVNLGVPVTTLNFVLAVSEPFTVKGTVSSLGGGALAGATVELDGGLRTITDANGSYGITNNPDGYTGAHTLTASLAGFMSSSVTFTIPNGATIIKNLVLAQLGSLSGTVRDTMGKPIAGATVTAGTVSGRSDATGAYSLAGLNPVPTNVTASAPRYDPTQIQAMISPGAHVVHDITLTLGSATLTGTITSAIDGTPVYANVAVAGFDSVQTDGTGRYTLTDVPAGDHLVTASVIRFFKPQTVSVHLIAHQILEQDFLLQSLHPPPPPRGPGGQPE
jgi:hypothetical protein